MKIMCDALKPSYSPDGVRCKRRATWVANWRHAGGRVWYCSPHKASRQKDKALKEWKRL